MSAYVVDREHIRYLVNAALRFTVTGSRFRWVWNLNHDTGGFEERFMNTPDGGDNAAPAGQMLWNACVHSVANRYPTKTLPNLPGPLSEDYDYDTHHGDGSRPRDPVQVLKACACYEYQCSESPEWHGSEAWGFIDELRRQAIRALPGYEEAVWGSPPPYTHLDPKEAARRVAARR